MKVSWKRKFHECLKGVLRFSRVFHDFQGCFQSVSKKFQEKVFQKMLHVARHSSQLPEQKEGLFCFYK